MGGALENSMLVQFWTYDLFPAARLYIFCTLHGPVHSLGITMWGLEGLGLPLFITRKKRDVFALSLPSL